MLTHDKIWQAVDRLATLFGYSPSGLAKQAGLDPTSFNKSKRFGVDGKPRWPSTESISRILGATGATMSDFLSLIDDEVEQASHNNAFSIPVIGFAQAGTKGYFDEDGYPLGDSWDEVQFPQFEKVSDSKVYALKINGDSMEPLYRKGDVLIVSPHAKIKRGDRIVIKTTGGEVMAKHLARQNSNGVELNSLNPAHNNIKIPSNDIAWMGRILWVSQ
ncbi:MAG: DNA-binding protein [Micavibrio sp.]|nr:DNA-binding protein [Micavibrio sp.]